MRKIWVIGDLHLSFDERVEKPMDVFGREWANHADRLRANWLELVSPEDTVLVPGDVSWGLRPDEALADLEWVHRLPGRKIFIKGNHDLWWTAVGRLNQLYEDEVFLQNVSYRIPDTDIYICGSRGWICPGTEGFSQHDEKIYRREVLRLKMSLDDARRQGAGEIIAMLHYPPTNDKLQNSKFTEALTEAGVRTCVYGHLHGRNNFRRGLVGVRNGVEYKLTSLDALAARPLLLREF